MGDRDDKNAEEVRRAQRALDRVSNEADQLGTSSAARMAKGSQTLSDRFKATDVDQTDPIELWGTRIGRGLGLIAFIGLAIYLFITYVLN